jgi:hypothetical protein
LEGLEVVIVDYYCSGSFCAVIDMLLSPFHGQIYPSLCHGLRYLKG